MANPVTTRIPPVTGGTSLRMPLSRSDYDNLGELRHTEYADGLLIVNPPTLRHQRILRRLVTLLNDACPPSHEVLIECGWQTAEDRERVPDIMISDVEARGDAMLIAPPPMLVVEILSASTRDIDGGEKVTEYGAAGAGWYWIVDPRQPSVVVFEQQAGNMVELQRITAPAATLGPFTVTVDPAVLTAP